MAETIRDLLTEALTDLGILAAGQPPSASQAQGALSKLNSMLDAWNIENLTVFGSSSNVFALTAGKATYTLGSGGDFSITRPATITGIYLRDTSLAVESRLDMPVQMLTNAEYEGLRLKASQGNLPYYAWVNSGVPFTEITLYPVPATSQFSLVLWTDDLLSGLTIDQAILLGPGYRRAVVSNLAVELAASYRTEAPATVQRIAISSKRAIQAANLQLNTLSLERLGSGYFDISTARYV